MEEEVVKAVNITPHHFRIRKSSEWSLDKGVVHYRGKIYVPKSDLRRRITFSLSRLQGCWSCW